MRSLIIKLIKMFLVDCITLYVSPALTLMNYSYPFGQLYVYHAEFSVYIYLSTERYWESWVSSSVNTRASLFLILWLHDERDRRCVILWLHDEREMRCVAWHVRTWWHGKTFPSRLNLIIQFPLTHLPILCNQKYPAFKTFELSEKRISTPFFAHSYSFISVDSLLIYLI